MYRLGTDSTTQTTGTPIPPTPVNPTKIGKFKWKDGKGDAGEDRIDARDRCRDQGVGKVIVAEFLCAEQHADHQIIEPLICVVQGPLADLEQGEPPIRPDIGKAEVQ